ncbi:MAG: helix-turn-helix domain-containing protein [Opitutaceae bacterium]|nr:helix-turn-helix domain-containing protein [Opitutaceae bacterium]
MFTIRWADVYGKRSQLAGYRSKRKPGAVFPRHNHDFDELFWVESGAVRHELNGKSTLLPAGTLVFVRAADVHELTWTGPEEGVLVNIALRSEALRKLRQRLFPSENVAWWAKDEHERHWQLRPEQLRTVVQAAAEVPGEVPELWRTERFVLNVMALQHPAASRTAVLPGEPEWLWEARQMMEDPAKLRRGVAALVTLSGCTAEHVARTVRRVYGKTPTEWVNDARVGWAAERLRITVDPITMIAQDAGFESLSHFYHLFGKSFGETPRRYRIRSQTPVA